MGSLLSCFSTKPSLPPPRPRPRPNTAGSSARWRGDPVLTHEEALAAARLLLGEAGDGFGVGVPFDRSASHRYPGESGRKKNGSLLPRSSSTRPRAVGDPLLHPHHLLNQDIKVDDLETNHFVLVHGGGFGAWCWYKTIALLEECGYKVDAVDLTGSGVHSFDTNKITSFHHYVKPLTDFMEKLGDGEKVILVGHDFGGACISYAMEAYSSKVTKAIFVCAAMPADGQSILDMFPQQEGINDQMRNAQKFVYANGKDHPPTAIDFDKTLVKDLLFNQSSVKDVALASVSMRSIPFAPVLEKLSLTDKNYGSIRRYCIQTTEDNAIPFSLQQSISNANPPERVFLLKGSDHAPFFSKPQAIHKLLVDISTIAPVKAPATQQIKPEGLSAG